MENKIAQNEEMCYQLLSISDDIIHHLIYADRQ